MIKSEFNVYKIILCLVLVPIYLSIIGLLFVTAFDDERLFDKYLVIIFLVIVFIVLSNILKKILIPRCFKCMEVVSDFISYRDLKEMLKEQKFQKVNIYEQNNKWKVYDVYVSDLWVYVNGIYVPRNLIQDIVKYSPGLVQGYVEFFFLVKNGKLIELGKIELRLLDSVSEVLKKEFEELEFSNNLSIAVFQSSILRDMKKKFISDVDSKEKFIEIISKKM